MKQLKLSLFGLLAIAVALFACQKEAQSPTLTSNAKGGKSKVYDVPALTQAGNSLTDIDIMVTAGATGAPSGFSIQWMTKAAFEANGSVWPTDETQFCKASFSGNANMSRYNLGAGESVTVTIGAFLFDNGASTNCPEDLVCGTSYVFRVFAHGDNVMNRSLFSSPEEMSTADCNPDCTRNGFGHWKKNCNEITSLTIGNPGISYTADELCTILNTPANGNGLLILAHQLIAAKLNGLTTTDADNAVGTLNILSDTKPASWQSALISSLRKGNVTCE